MRMLFLFTDEEGERTFLRRQPQAGIRPPSRLQLSSKVASGENKALGRGCSQEGFWRAGSKGSRTAIFLFQKTHRFIYYSDTGWAVGAEESDFEGWAFPFPGVTLLEDFVTREEETEMVQLMDREPWKLSQSGRRKQVGWPRTKDGGQPIREDSHSARPLHSPPTQHPPWQPYQGHAQPAWPAHLPNRMLMI